MQTGVMARLRRAVLVVLGTVFTTIGIVGIVVPLLPTTPFLLLAAACYVRGSERAHRWLVGNRVLGAYIRCGGGPPPPFAVSLATLVLLWAAIGVSAWRFVPEGAWWARVLLVVIATAVTIHILRVSKRRPRPVPPQ
jgi:uncharacterized protein